mmetsp:Transcript_34085/g.87921  ORF Transcript_34085/g.87921 Transcript_34085/m.87921 type:complete len:275 (-) Transcript_34085:1047-1871(-)
MSTYTEPGMSWWKCSSNLDRSVTQTCHTNTSSALHSSACVMTHCKASSTHITPATLIVVLNAFISTSSSPSSPSFLSLFLSSFSSSSPFPFLPFSPPLLAFSLCPSSPSPSLPLSSTSNSLAPLPRRELCSLDAIERYFFSHLVFTLIWRDMSAPNTPSTMMTPPARTAVTHTVQVCHIFSMAFFVHFALANITPPLSSPSPLFNTRGMVLTSSVGAVEVAVLPAGIPVVDNMEVEVGVVEGGWGVAESGSDADDEVGGEDRKERQDRWEREGG